jgi:hypothetical protein
LPIVYLQKVKKRERGKRERERGRISLFEGYN